MQIRDVMTADPTVCPASADLATAGRLMREQDIGDVLVERDGALCGIVTDRDIVIRAVADDLSPSTTRLGDICTGELITLRPEDTVEEAVEVMRAKALRRLPVCEGTRAVGVVSLGDLARERDPNSALADISEAPPSA
jgi:CBS domain-containing protein